jgi:photosystem II stability/assembly factor-like uncharacterized protein
MLQQRILPALWIAVITFFIGFVPQMMADVNTKSDENGWMQTNGPYGGSIYTLYATPEGVLFAGTGGAGIFRSMDLGDSWTPVNTGLRDEPGAGLSASAFAQKRNMLYAGTTDGLYASIDNGDRWYHVPTLSKYVSVSGIVTIGARVYIGTLGDGVWYSDDGDSWMPINDGLENRLIRELSKIGTTLVAGTEDGAFRKRFSDDSWTPINTGFVPQPMDMAPINKARLESGGTPLPPYAPTTIRVDAFTAMENLLYMGILMGGDDGLFRSDDEGDSWTRITSKEMTHTVEALTTFGRTLYASTYGGGVFRSEDSGDSWTTVNNGLTDWTVSALLAVGEDIVFVGTTDGGIFRTTDGGDSWTEANTGLTNTSVTELEVLEGTIYAGIGHRLVYSVDGGGSWQRVQIPSLPVSYHFAALSEAGGKLYVAGTKFAPGDVVGGIFQLDEARNSLIELTTDSELYGIECMEIVESTFYVGTQGRGVFRWDQDSDSWTSLGLEGHVITAVSVNRKKIYAATQHGEIFRLEGTGKPWKLISSDMVGSFISDLRGFGSIFYATSLGRGVFRSTNNGNSWTPLNEGLEDLSVMTIDADDTNTYIGTYYDGVFRWRENRKRWERIGSLRRRVDSLVIHDGFLYAGTVGGGVFRVSIGK